jgi:hypothetical protein
MNNFDEQIPQECGTESQDPIASTTDLDKVQDRTEPSSTSSGQIAPEPAVSSKPQASEARLKANRANAQRSTGPKTAQGKRNSSFNSYKHGMLAKKLMFGRDGKVVDEGMNRLFESLRHEFCTGNVASEILTELLLADYLRLSKAAESEAALSQSGGGQFSTVLMRYTSQNRRSLEKSLQMLMRLQEKDQDEKTGEELKADAGKGAVTEGEEDSPQRDEKFRNSESEPG